jgi:hypothetical protein
MFSVMETATHEPGVWRSFWARSGPATAVVNFTRSAMMETVMEREAMCYCTANSAIPHKPEP